MKNVEFFSDMITSWKFNVHMAHKRVDYLPMRLNKMINILLRRNITACKVNAWQDSVRPFFVSHIFPSKPSPSEPGLMRVPTLRFLVPGNSEEICKKFIMLLLFGYALSALAMPDDGIALKLDDELGSTATEGVSSPMLTSPIAIIYDEQQQRALYAKNVDSVVPIASISKLMMAMVVLDAQLPLDQKISINERDMVDNFEGSHSRMRPGMTLARGELLKLALMASENRAAAALARTYPGGTRAAVAKMNAKARALGMKDTNFIDSTGLSSGNVSTAQDLVKMVLAAENYEPIHKATTSVYHRVEPTGFKPMSFGNTNPLVRNAAWNIGISKTGYISEAGRCIVMKANINHHSVVIVLLDSGSKRIRSGDADRIKEWMESV
jgi:D-alanyl-D-alanine endopeptidase (penicillin-binding protein 7)